MIIERETVNYTLDRLVIEPLVLTPAQELAAQQAVSKTIADLEQRLWGAFLAPLDRLRAGSEPPWPVPTGPKPPVVHPYYWLFPVVT